MKSQTRNNSILYVSLGLLFLYAVGVTYWGTSLERQLKIEKLNVKAAILSRDAANFRADMFEAILKAKGVTLP